MADPTTMPEPFASIQTAIVAALATEDITCYDYEPLELFGAPSAYLRATDASADYGRAHQGELFIGLVPYSLKYFVSLERNERNATAQAYDGVRSMFSAFADATLGGAVRDIRVERVSIDPVEMGADRRPMLLVEASLQVRPAQYP